MNTKKKPQAPKKKRQANRVFYPAFDQPYVFAPGERFVIFDQPKFFPETFKYPIPSPAKSSSGSQRDKELQRQENILRAEAENYLLSCYSDEIALRELTFHNSRSKVPVSRIKLEGIFRGAQRRKNAGKAMIWARPRWGMVNPMLPPEQRKEALGDLRRSLWGRYRKEQLEYLTQIYEKLLVGGQYVSQVELALEAKVSPATVSKLWEQINGSKMSRQAVNGRIAETKKDATRAKIVAAIQKLSTDGVKITAKNIAKESGVPERTVKWHKAEMKKASVPQPLADDDYLAPIIDDASSGASELLTAFDRWMEESCDIIFTGMHEESTESVLVEEEFDAGVPQEVPSNEVMLDEADTGSLIMKVTGYTFPGEVLVYRQGEKFIGIYRHPAEGYTLQRDVTIFSDRLQDLEPFYLYSF